MIGCLVVLLLSGLPAVVGAKGAGEELIFVQEPAAAEGGSRIVHLLPDGGTVVLTEGFAAASEPSVSFDGRKVLFAGRMHAGDPWDIWEMDVDGSRKVKVTADMGDCREPAYLARAAVDAPNFRDKVRWITFTSTATGAIDELGRRPLTSLYAMSLTPVPGRGTVVWRTTYGLGGVAAPTVLADGRVLFSSWQREGYGLMTISWAGENMNPFFGLHDGAMAQLSACELPDERRLVFIEGEGEPEDRSGRLAEVSFRRPLYSHRVLSTDDGRYRTPQRAADGGLLVAHASGGGDYGIYRFDEKKGRPGQKLFDAPGWHDVDPQAVAVREEPIGRIPTVEFASVLDVGGFKQAGQLQCMSVYESDREEVQKIRKGRVKRVRLIEGLPLSMEEGQRLLQKQKQAQAGVWPPPFVRTRPLGEAPVEEDGSFYVNVAGDVPFYIEMLDGQGEVLTSMRSWIWVRSGDQRGCIGCHEDKEMGPPNRATQALVKARPATLLGPRENPGAEH